MALHFTHSKAPAVRRSHSVQSHIPAALHFQRSHIVNHGEFSFGKVDKNQQWHQRSAPAASTRPARHSVVAYAAAIGTSQGLAEYICQGPLLSNCGLTADSVQKDIATWEQLGKRLAEQLHFDHSNMTPVQMLRIYHYYLPVYFWIEQQLQQHKAKGGPHTALVLGISAPQGCGKSTLVEQLELLWQWRGTAAAAVSVDDFYLTYKDQCALGAANPDNRLLQLRGNAGSHDLQLGTATLKALQGLSAGQTAQVPRYDKSAYSGRGDRASQEQWPTVSGPLDVVLFEGWMSGFAPVEDAAAEKVEPALVAVNQQLRKYKAAWDDVVDSWLVIRMADPQWVFSWRKQAEDKMKAGGKPGMSDEQIADFVSRFMPAYKAYLPGLYAKGPTTAKAGKTLVVEVDANRSPVQPQPAPVL